LILLDEEKDTTHIIIHCSHNYSSNHQEPVGHRDVNLAMEQLAGVDHLDMREITQPHNLRKQLEAARYHRLGCNDSRQDSNNERWIERSWGYRVEEGIRVCSLCGVLADIGSLPNICKEEAWVGEGEPRELNRPI
jgi:hypothetical protein